MANSIFTPFSGVPASNYTYGNFPTGNAAYNIWGSTGVLNPYIIFGPSYTPGQFNPNTGQPLLPRQPLQTSSSDDNGGDGGNTPPGMTTQEYLQATEAGKAGVGSSPFLTLNALQDIAYGINPLGDLTGQGNQTFGWYDGSTGQYGDPYSDMSLAQQANAAAVAAYNQDFIDDMLDPNATLQDYINDYRQSYGISAPTATTPTTNNFAQQSYTTSAPATAQTFAANADPALVAAANKAMAQQQQAQAAAAANAAAGNPAPTGSVTMSDGSTVGSLSDMAAGTSGSYSSANSGDVGVTSYGDGQYGFTDTNGEEVGYEDPGGDDSGDDSGDSGSYIATATTQALGEEGLKVFEDWRDYMFNVLPTFTSSFGRYRVTAPKIVEEIDKKENSKEIYKGIWDKYLKPIFDIIKTDKDSKKALKDYKVMVRELSNKYLKGVSDGK